MRLRTPIGHSTPQQVSPYWKNDLKSAEQVFRTHPILLVPLITGCPLSPRSGTLSQERDSTNRLVCECPTNTTFLLFLVRRFINVLQGIFSRPPQFLKNSKYKFLCFRLSPIDVVVYRHEDNSIFELFKLNSLVFHRPSDLMKQLQCCVS